MAGPEPGATSCCRAVVARIAAFAAAFAAHVLLLRQAIDWDGLAFLGKTRAAWFADPAHLLYPAVLQGAVALGDMLGFDGETAGRLLSALCGASAFVLLWAVIESDGVPRLPALLAAALAAAAPAWFRQMVSIEVYAPMLLFLAAAFLLAGRHRTTGGLGSLFLAILALGLAAGFHFAAAFAIFGLWARAFPRGTRSLAGRVLALALIAGAMAAGCVVLDGLPAEEVIKFVEWIQHVQGFLHVPVSTADALDLAGDHTARLGRFFLDEAPVTVLAGLAGIIVLARKRRPVLGPLLVPVLPFLSAFVLFGVPVLGLLLPVLPIAALAAGRGAAALGEARPRLAAMVLGAALVAQGALLAPRALDDARTPDLLKADALLVAQHLPKGALVLEGRLAQHLRSYTEAQVLAIDEIFPPSRRSVPPLPEPVAVLRATLRSHRGRRVYITPDGVKRLFASALPYYGSPGRTEQELNRQLLSAEPPILIRPPPDDLWLQRVKSR